VSRIFVSKNYQNLIIDFKVTVENVGDAFLGHSAKPVQQTVEILRAVFSAI